MVAWICAVSLFGFFGIMFVATAAEAREALEHGEPGTFSADHTERHGRAKRHWVGTFVSDDGTVTEPDVALTQTGWVGHDDEPPVVDAALGGSEEHPRAYDRDYDVAGRTVMGIVALALSALVGLGGLVVRVIRARRAQPSADGPGDPQPSSW